MDNLVLVSPFTQWIALGNIAVLCLSRPKLKRLDPLTAALSCYGLSLLVTSVASVCAAWLTPTQLALLGGGLALRENSILRNLLISAIVSAVVPRYFYVQHQWKALLHKSWTRQTG
jgi:two-component system sensor histidine kinase AlgZ